MATGSGCTSTSLSSSMSLEYSSDNESCQESEESEVANEKTVVSLMDRLKSPTPANRARPRKIQKNDLPRCQRKSKGSSSSHPKNVTPSQRVRV